MMDVSEGVRHIPHVQKGVGDDNKDNKRITPVREAQTTVLLMQMICCHDIVVNAIVHNTTQEKQKKRPVRLSPSDERMSAGWG